MVQSGKARLLAMASAEREPMLPDGPTFREQGFDLVAKPWYSLFAPVGTPRPVIDRLAKAVAAATQDPATRQRLIDMGLQPTGDGSDKLAAVVKEDFELRAPVIKASGFKPGQWRAPHGASCVRAATLA